MSLLLSLPLLMLAPPAPAAGRIPAAVREHISRRVELRRTAGIVVGVVDAGGTELLAKGLLHEGGAPVTEDSIFEIGSITKVFTATLLAGMVSRGEVSLDQPVAALLPAPGKAPSRGGKVITLGDLATHRSGLPRLPEPFDPPDHGNPYAAYSGVQLLAFLASHELARDPGTAYEYSNLGAGLLGYALARRAGTSYEELVQKRIARPLGLSSTGVGLSAAQTSRRARGHVGRREVPAWDFDALAGAGALRSTARDMLRFLSANLGLIEGDPLPELAAMRRTTWETGTPGLSMALGWHVVTRKDGTTFHWHNGGTGGFHSFCGFDLAQRRGVVVLANGAEDIDDIGWHVLDPKTPLPQVRPTVEVAPAALDELTGRYEIAPRTSFQITREGTQLFAQVTGQTTLPLLASSPLEFFYEAVDARLTFVRDASGRVDRLVLHQNGDHEARRVTGAEPPPPVEVAVDAAVLKRYVGTYQLAPGMLFDVRLDGERLAVKLGDQPRFPVFAESPTRFFYKVVAAKLTFVVDGAGAVTGLVLHQGGRDQPARKLE